jgi:hypothetical protein
MSQPAATTDPVAAQIAEADAVATLHRLNADYVRAFAEADTAWYREHLSDDFVCTLADGRRIDKTEFLRRNAETRGVADVSFDEVDVRPQGAVALVHGVAHYVRNRARTSTRYTVVWLARDGRWHAVAAHLTHIAGT